MSANHPYGYSYPEVVQNDWAPSPVTTDNYNMPIGPAHPASPAPAVTTQVSSSTAFHNSLLHTKQSLNPSGVHVLDVPYSPGHNPEDQRQHNHHQFPNGQFQRPQAPVDEALPPYPATSNHVTENNTFILVQERPKRGTWDRLLDISKSRVGAVWYCISSFVAIAMFSILLAGCASPSTSPFATNIIRLSSTSSYSSVGDGLTYSTSYRARNPSTGKDEKPIYILFGFSGHCNVFEVRSGTSSAYFPKQCERQFVAPLFLPPPDLTKNNGASLDGLTDLASVNAIRRAVAAMVFIMMFYALGTSVAVCLGHWKTVFKLWWVNVILVIITVALFYFDTYSFWSPIGAFGYGFLGSVLDSDASVLGMYLFHVALFTMLTANLVVLAVFFVLGTVGLIFAFWLFWCFLIAWVGY